MAVFGVESEKGKEHLQLCYSMPVVKSEIVPQDLQEEGGQLISIDGAISVGNTKPD